MMPLRFKAVLIVLMAGAMAGMGAGFFAPRVAVARSSIQSRWKCDASRKCAPGAEEWCFQDCGPAGCSCATYPF